MPLTPEQERALAVPGPRVAVAAGAGSGKTTMLVEAIWRDVERDQVAVEDIFAATYNRAAAGHLLSRLHERFSDPDDGRPRGLAALDTSAGWIGTFHGLCARIVREHPFAAGVDPGFAELDEAQSSALVEGALDEATAATGDPGFRDLLAQSGSSKGVRDAARAVYDRLRAAGMEAPRLRVPAAATLADADWDQLAQALERVAGHLDLNDRHQPGLAAGRLLVASRVAAPDCPRITTVARQTIKPLIEGANDALREAWEVLVEGEARAQLLGFAAFLEGFDDAYQAAKRERGALDFEDLQLRARRVLRGPHPYRFRRAYVDEFQDANAVQNEILDALDAERTLVVGDGCQAIYGFRHASAEHFLERVAGGGGGLHANHRSQPVLMEALNDLLERAMDGQPAFARLTSAAVPDPDPPLHDPPIELVTVAGDQGPTSRAQEAEVVARMVARFVGEDGYRYRDVAVLFRALTEVEPYRAAMEAVGLPVHLVAGRGFFTHEQVADALALLALVENPWDEPALLRVAASPYVAASDEALVALRRAAGAYQPLWPAVAAVDELAALLLLVDGLRPLLHERGLAGLTDAVVAARGYDLAILGLADGERRHANLRQLVRLAEDFAAVRGPDLRGFLRQMTAVADDPRLDPGEATLVDPNLDAVRLATIHAVKGQQFPVVVIADASHRIPGDSSLVLADRDGTAGIRAQRAGGQRPEVLGYTALKQAAAAQGAQEERRLLYVATTRAMRHLAVVGRAERNGGGPDTPYSIVRAALESNPAATWEEHLDTLPMPERLELPVPPDVTPAPDPPSPAPIAVPAAAGRRLSFSALSTHAVCARRYMLEWELRLPPPGRALPVEGAGSSGTEVGTLVHVALAGHAWGGPTPSAGWAGPLAARLGLDVPPEALARAEFLVADLGASDLATRIGRGRPVAERTFAMELDGVLLTGAIDLEVREPDGGVLLVDWKTHALGGGGPETTMEGYRLQQSLYGLAALRAGVDRVELAWVFLEALSAPQVRIVTATDEDALAQEVRGHLDALARPDRPPASTTPKPFCNGCPGLEMYCPVSEAVA